MKIPDIVIVKNRKYIFVKEYESYIRYKEAEAGYMMCFNKQELGLIPEEIKPNIHLSKIGRRSL